MGRNQAEMRNDFRSHPVLSAVNIQSIYNIAQICAAQHIANAILSPGSRCAPLLVGFSRHPAIATRVIIDERSAAYIALGIAQQTRNPVVLVCTSGTAALNYAPAIAEAYFLQVPLLVLTADRPAEWIEQQDGQTIHQTELYGKHVKKFYQLPVDTSAADAQWHFERVVSEAIILSRQEPQGPVHLNIPVREPFYPKIGEQISFNLDVKIIRCIEAESILTASQWQDLLCKIDSCEKVLILCGQYIPGKELKSALQQISKTGSMVLCSDILANLHGVAVSFADGILALQSDAEVEALKPDLLITFGLSVLSKNVKAFFRKCHVQKHWHIQPSALAADAFQSLTDVVQVKPEYFFVHLAQLLRDRAQNTEFRLRWQQLQTASVQALNQSLHLTQTFSGLQLMRSILNRTDKQCILHLGNSMSVRYANMFGVQNPDIDVYCNRGTSGIDGCVSTALGHALVSDKLNILVVGDVSVLYDRNAFWNRYIPDNFRVIVMNDFGGGIFRLIEGPGNCAELDECFVAHQRMDASHIAEEAGFDYIRCDSFPALENGLDCLFDPAAGKMILELFTDREVNTLAFNHYKMLLKNHCQKLQSS
jgi:2-succinyl-5-enolpyruvyl-6-hydroxy-3-cyclohexene-1-carboxylate synthase